MKLDNKQKRMVLIVSILLLTIGVTFAYFMAQTGAGAKSNANITADTVDDLKFSVSKDSLSLNINQFNFAKDSGNISDSITATASLKANSTKKTATNNYYVYFLIENNEYFYTTEDMKPEIILSITGPNGEITSLNNLSYVTATSADGTEVKGFDITGQKSSPIIVAEQQEITSTSSMNYTNQEWNFTITFINLDSDQTDNEGKTLTGKVLIQKDKAIDNLSEVTTAGENLVNALESLNAKGLPIITKLYHHDETLINGAGDNSYRYSGAFSPEYYSCKYNGNDVYNSITSEFNHSSKGDCSQVYKLIIGNETEYYDKTFANSYYNTYTVSWDSTNNKCVTSTNAEVFILNGESITDSSKCTGTAYQYKETTRFYLGIEKVGSGVETLYKKEEDINNYVCFGSDDATCTDENLYRIIGIINGKVKLISAYGATIDMLGTESDTYDDIFGNVIGYSKITKNLNKVGAHYWNTTGENDWASSILNNDYLNSNFLTYLDGKNTKWKTMIDDTTWYVGGVDTRVGKYVPAPVVYDYEVGTKKDTTTTVTSKIGLMYISDYYYGVVPEFWPLEPIQYTFADYNNNWMNIGLFEWTISRNNSDYNWYVSNFVFRVNGNGGMGNAYAGVQPHSVKEDKPVVFKAGGNDPDNEHGALRPVFNLVSSVKYVSGSGTSENPIRISL